MWVGEGAVSIRADVVYMSDMPGGIFSFHAYQSTIIASHPTYKKKAYQGTHSTYIHFRNHY